MLNVGEFDRFASVGAVSIALAKPKSSTFTLPSGVILMLAGFRSRWMMPCSWAASSASAICFAMGSASSIGIGPRSMRSASVGALDQLHHEGRCRPPDVFDAVELRDVGMIQRGEHLRLPLEAGQAIRIAGETLPAGP